MSETKYPAGKKRGDQDDDATANVPSAVTAPEAERGGKGPATPTGGAHTTAAPKVGSTIPGTGLTVVAPEKSPKSKADSDD